jgi:polyisoprenoid-binding protein YceI
VSGTAALQAAGAVVPVAPVPLVPTPAPAEVATRGATTYRLDPGSSRIWALLRYDRTTIMKGHDHVVQASTFTGSVVWSPADPSVCSVDISFPVTALTIDPPGARARAGLEKETPEEDLPKIKENMLSKGQLNASSFPQISYKATSCSGTSGSVTLKGNMTLHGVTKPVSITMQVSEDGSSFTAKGSTTISHSMFGFAPFVAPLGVLKNEDNLKLTIDVRGAAR